MSSAELPAHSSQVPPSQVSWAWWPFFFGVVVGYVLFRPGGVVDYFLLPGGFRGNPEIPSWMGQDRRGGAAGQFRRGQQDRYSSRPAPGGQSGEEELFDDENFDSPLPAPQRPGGDIKLPPTDLFGSSGSGLND